MTVIHRLVGNTSLLLVSNLVVRGASAFLFIVAAHQLDQKSVGVYSLGITYSVVLLAISSWGLDQILIRDVARTPSKAARYLTNFFVLRTGISGLVYGSLWLILHWFHPYAYGTIQVVLIIGLVTIPDSLNEICQAVFISKERILVPVMVTVGLALVRIGLGTAILLKKPDLLLLSWVFPLTSFVSMAATVGLILDSGIRPELHFNGGWLRRMLVSGTPLAAINVLLVLDVQASVVLLSLLISETAVALYGAANAVFTALSMVSAAWQTSVFPLMSRLFERTDGTFEWFYEKMYLYLTIGALAVILCVMALADAIILKLYGPDFGQSVSVLRIMTILLFFSFLNIPNSRLMIILNRQDVLALFLAISVLINVSVSWLWIPHQGPVAAATTRLISAALFFLMNFWFVSRRIRQVKLLKLIGRPLAAGLIAMTLMIGLRNLAPLWRAIAMLTSYGLLLWFSKAIPREDLSSMLRLFALRFES